MNRPLKITGHTEMIGILADPIRHSKSPEMHNAAFNALGLDYVYLVFEVGTKDLKTAVEGLKVMGVRGYNLSMPNKTEIMKYLDHISLVSKLCGAVNTVINDDGVLTGTSTDGIGFVRAVEEAGVSVKDKKIVVLGAGGAARAIIAQSAIDKAKEIVVFKRKNASWNEALENMNLIEKETGCKVRLEDMNDHALLHNELKDADILVNGTSVGMAPNTESCIVEAEDLHKDLAVFDAVYNPMETLLLKRAKQAGALPIGGIGMLLYQGAESFRLWTGKDMPIDVVKEALGYK